MNFPRKSCFIIVLFKLNVAKFMLNTGQSYEMYDNNDPDSDHFAQLLVSRWKVGGNAQEVQGLSNF